MKASELRIGNYVTIDNPLAWPNMKDVPLAVNGVRAFNDEDFPESTGDVSLQDGEYCQFDEFIKPIPLTEEWLLKFGFRHDLDQEIWNHDNICISYLAERLERGFKLYANHEYEIGVPFKYVHQLQNLCFALTGEELTIKL